MQNREPSISFRTHALKLLTTRSSWSSEGHMVFAILIISFPWSWCPALLLNPYCLGGLDPRFLTMAQFAFICYGLGRKSYAQLAYLCTDDMKRTAHILHSGCGAYRLSVKWDGCLTTVFRFRQQLSRPFHQAFIQRVSLYHFQQYQQPIVAGDVIYLEFLIQKFLYSLAACPLMDLAHIFESAKASKHYYADRLRYTAKISVVFFGCFHFFEVLC